MKIYILDTGCNKHDFFIEHNININFIDDKNGHGTNVAGIVSNIAPKEEYHILQVMNSNGKGNCSTICEAIEEAINNNADVILMSIGIDKNKEELYNLVALQNLKKAYDAWKILDLERNQINAQIKELTENIGKAHEYIHFLIKQPTTNALEKEMLTNISKILSLGSFDIK